MSDPERVTCSGPGSLRPISGIYRTLVPLRKITLE